LTSRKTRIVLLAAAVLIGAVLVAFAVAVIDGRSTERAAAERRFNDQAQVSAALIQSIFDSSAGTLAQQNAERFGGPRIDPRALQAFVKRGQLSYAVVLDERGEVLEATAGADQGVLGAIDERPRHVTQVLQGAPWGLSGLNPGNTAEYASAFASAAGGQRVMVQGFPVELLQGFVGDTLAKLPDAEAERAYVVDGNGRVVSAADEEIRVAQPAPAAGDDRAEATAVINGSDWRVVISREEAELYEGTGSLVDWLILAALSLAGLTALYLLVRAMRQSEELERAYASLEAANADLGRTNAELARSNSELEQFASVASHDLQEPLRKVQTFGDQLERRHGASLDEEAKDYLRRMRSASARMSVLIDDLLRFSRVTTHAKPHVAVDLQRVAREVVQDLETRIADSGGQVDIGRLPTVRADPTQMRQLLQNLIGNALKFHRPGVPPVVAVTPVPAPRPGTASFAVRDNGIGFEDTYTERIFRVFERLHPRDVYAGTGIGLALCRKIAERHGGSITAEGRPGEGATFTVVLPAAQEAPGAGAPSPAEPVHA
jgi:signal transduction histidine kinase